MTYQDTTKGGKNSKVNTNERICIAEGCSNRSLARGYCPNHYTKLRLFGSPYYRSGKQHGKSYSPEWWSWRRMRVRCYNPKNNRYIYYGGRGIKVCGRWKSSFKAFYEDMGPKPSPEYSIDRINTNGHYSCGKCEECVANDWPANCRWATKLEQSLNTGMRKDNKSGYRGVVLTKSTGKFHAQASLNGKRVHLGSYHTPEEAATAYEDYRGGKRRANTASDRNKRKQK